MTTRLLTLAALAWASSAMAGDWELPAPPTDANAVPVEDLGHYYATPKGSGQFLKGGNSWGTQASLDTQGYEVVMYHNADLGTGATGDDWSFCFPAITTGNKSWLGDFLFAQSDGTSIYCNAFNGKDNIPNDNRKYIHFTLTLNPDGQTYRVSHEHGADKFLGWDGVTLGNDKDRPHTPILAWIDPSVKTPVLDEAGEETGETVDPFVDWAFIPAYLYAAYDAKLKLYDKLNEGEEKKVQLDDVLAVYNNPTATAEQVNEMYDILSERIMNAVVEGEEVEVTALYIKNPDCAADEGWSGFKNQTHNYPEAGPTDEGAQITGRFFEMWKKSAADVIASLDDATLKQTITIPAGKYRLQADVIATQQADAEVAVEGVYLYANGGTGLQKSEPVSTANGVPQIISVEFACTGTAQIGLMLDATNANWVAVDNFKLFFKGYIDNPNEIELQGYKAALPEYEDEKFSAATTLALADLLQEIETALAGNDEEAMAPVAAKAKDFEAALIAEIAAYKNLKAFAAKVADDVDVYGGYGSFGDTLSEYAGTLDEGYADGLYGTAEIEEMIASYDKMLEDGVRKFISEEATVGADVSVLIKNRDMDEGITWVNGKNGQQLPGWGGTLPWAHDQSATEFWNMDFDFYQDIEGLPQGKYTVSFQGFYRWGTADEAISTFGTPDDEANIIARIYGNAVETPFKSIVNGTKSYEGDVPGGWAKVDDERCMPNTMTTFQEMVALDPKAYYSEATAIVGPDGHLRIGIKASGHMANSWVIFDSFRLRYDGNEADMFFDEMDRQADALVAKRDLIFGNKPMPKDLYDSVDVLATECDDVKAKADADACADYFARIAAKSAEIDSVMHIVDDVLADYNYFYDNMLADASSAEFSTMMDDMYTIVQGNVCPWATTDELAAFKRKFNALFVAGVQSNGNAATETEPFDMTVVVRNPEFQTPNNIIEGMWNDVASTDYWEGDKPGTSYNAAEFYNKNYDMHQTIVGLPKGYYSVQVQGYYRQGTAQAHADSIVAGTEYLPAQLYATVDGQSWASPLMSIFNGAPHEDLREVTNDKGELAGTISSITSMTSEEDPIIVPLNMCYATELFDKGYYGNNSVTFQVAAESADVTIGVKKDSVYAADWTMFDHFRLYYLGQEEPVGIIGVQGSTGKAQGLAVKQAYYTVGGLQLARPQRGVNIVVTTLPDGTKTTAKVIVK